MRTPSRLPWCAAFALAAAVSAQQDCSQSAVLIVQFGPGDLVLNEPLLVAILDDPALETEVRRLGGSVVNNFDGIGVALPAPHTAGTFQIHFGIDLNGPGPLPRATADAIVDAVAGHLEKRLDLLLFEQPRRQLTARADELKKRHEALLHEQAEVDARTAGAAAEAESLHKLRAELAEQTLAVRLELATEQRAIEHLEKLAAQHRERRDALRTDKARLDTEIAARQREAGLAQAQIDGLLRAAEQRGGASADQQAQIQKLRSQLADLEAQTTEVRHRQDRADEQLADLHETLARTFEQLPASTLAIQRAQARLAGLAAEQQHLDERAARAAAQRADGAALAARAEQLRIDVTVCRTLLTEVQGRLGRLEPVRYELLRRR